jgi:transposase InsO family protein
MGLANYYRKFIKGFSKLSSPITQLLRHNQKWSWGEEQNEAFEKLKTSFMEAPILRIFDPSLTCRVATDASDKAIGGILEQLFPDTKCWHAIAFESRKLIPAELNYPVHEKELLAIVHCLKVWRHYLEGQGHFKVYSDHLSLRYFHTQKDLSRRQARWSELLSNYDFEITYKPGSQNNGPDALSRQPQNFINLLSTLPGRCVEINTDEDVVFLDGEEIRQNVLNLIKSTIPKSSTKVLKILDLTTTAISSSLLDEIKENLKNDLWFQKVQFYLENSSLPRPPSISAQLRSIKFTNGLVTKDGRLFIPTDALRTKLLQERHDSSLGGHFGQNKIEENISRDFYWPQMTNFIRDYINTCDICQRTKKRRHKKYGLLKPLPIPSRPWLSTSIDFVTGLPKTKTGFDSILVVVDRFSKMVHLFSCHSTDTAEDIAKLFLKVIALHGVPETLISDRDSKFISHFWQSLFKRIGTKLKMSTSFHPQTDGQTERANQVMEQVLRAYVSYDQKDWEELLPLVEFSINNTISASTGQTPYYTNFGYHPRVPSSVMGNDLDTRSPLAADFHERLAKLQEDVAKRIHEAQARQKRLADQNRSEYTFNKGDLVLLSTQNLAVRRPSKKLDHTFVGPFKILEVISSVAYRLELPSTWKIHDIFHVSLLEPYHTSDAYPNRTLPPPPPELIDGEDEYEVEKILDKRRSNGRFEYLVKWVGYPYHQATWEPLEHLKHCENLLEDYECSATSIPLQRSRHRFNRK